MRSAVHRRRPWLVLSDAFPTRVFVDCGIVTGLKERLGGALETVLVLPDAERREWAGRLEDIDTRPAAELFPIRVGLVERAIRRLDSTVDRRLGYYPLAVRHSLRAGFHSERMRAGHPNLFLDASQARLVPRSERLEQALVGWHYSTHRYVSRTLLREMKRGCSGIVLANVQSRPAVPFLLAARRLGLPVVGYVASWDHTVGKGLVSPRVTRYIVQNDVMRDDLVRYHGISADRIVITGWPQTDVFHRQRPRQDFDEVVRSLGLDPVLPVVLYAGNTPTNAPFEGRLVGRLVQWWQERGVGRLSLVLRPHPRDRDWLARFAPALGVEGIGVQEPSYTDIDTLATILQHVGCVVANAGTILLDALVNDRPAVCVLYDEGAPAGERFAALNVTGAHYQELVASEAFVRAYDFGGVVSGIEHALDDPDGLGAERARVAREVVGDVDGRATERVVDAVIDIVEAPR